MLMKKYFANAFLSILVSLLCCTDSNAQYKTVFYEEISVSIPSKILFEIAADETNSNVPHIEEGIKNNNENVKKVEIFRDGTHILLKIHILKDKDILAPTLSFYKNEFYKLQNKYARTEITKNMKKGDPKIKSIKSSYENNTLGLTISYSLPYAKRISLVDRPLTATATEAARKKREAEEVARKKREAEEAAAREKQEVAAIKLVVKSKDVLDYEIDVKPILKGKDKVPVDKVALMKKEEARKKREAAEAARKKREAEKAARKKREAAEVAHKKREAEKAAKQKKMAEEAERKKRETEVAARKKREAEEAARARLNSKKVLTVHKLPRNKVPKVDGISKESLWRRISPTDFILTKADGKRVTVQLKATYSRSTIYILAVWPDRTRNESHETLVWDRRKGEYYNDKDMEDSISFLYYMDDLKNSCMKSGIETEADYWHWRAARLKGSKFSFDGKLKISSTQLPHANPYPSHNGKVVWIQKKNDRGKTPWKIQLPIKYEGDKVPSYRPRDPTGSAADVSARGRYTKNKWTVEFSRKLSTGNSDDVDFDIKKKQPFAVAVYNSSAKQDHFASDLLTLEFQ